MTTNKYDPLEAAKVTADSHAVDEATLAAGKKPAAKAQPVNAPPPEPVKPAPPAAPVGPRVRFRVTADCKASFNGYITGLKKGTLLDPAGYGGEEKLAARAADGLPLERIEI